MEPRDEVTGLGDLLPQAPSEPPGEPADQLESDDHEGDFQDHETIGDG